jgi:hypothetical protein
MWILLFVLLVTLCVAFWKRRELGPLAKPVLIGLVAVALLTSIFQIRTGSRAPQIHVQTDFHVAAGMKLGQAVAAALPEGGTVVVLHSGANRSVLKQIIPARIKGLKKGFGTTNIQLVEVEPRTQAEQNALLSMDMDVQIPGEQFRQDIQRVPDAKAVISMLGAPSGPKSPQPLFLLGSVSREEVQDLLRNGAIQGAVFYQDEADWSTEPQPGMSLEDIFDLRYEIQIAPGSTSG